MTEQHTPPIIALNSLTRADTGVWTSQKNDVEPHTGRYDSSLQYIEKLFDKIADFSLHSPMIERGIMNLETDYLLSPSRSHVLHMLRLDGADRVLEFGCLCGNVTRYLSEHGIGVDAIESDRRLATLATKRCGDQPHAYVVGVRPDALQLPERKYDVILMLGMLETPHYYIGDEHDPDAAVRFMLAHAVSALAPEGVIVIASDNRVGLKYVLGFPEEHSRAPYAGIRRFAAPVKGRTYSKHEWLAMLRESNLDASSFCYAFPDFKLPSVMLSDEYISHSEYAYTHACGMASRDYTAQRNPSPNEAQIWEALHQSNHIGNYANSFLIVAGRNRSAVDGRMSADFVHVSGIHRRARFRVITKKPRGQSLVCKSSLVAGVEGARTSGPITQVLQTEPYVEGLTLSRRWERVLECEPQLDRMLELVHDYHQYLCDHQVSSTDSDELLDLLPRNIIVSDTGAYTVIDKEWRLRESIDVEYVLFRAILYFINDQRSIVSAVVQDSQIETARQLIAYCFAKLGLDFGARAAEFIERENRVQRAIRSNSEHSDTGNEINQLISAEQFFPHLFWSLEGEFCNSENMRSITASYGNVRQDFEFTLPPSITRLAIIRFDPAKRIGYFHIYRFSITYRSRDGQRRSLLDFSDADAIANFASLHNVEYGLDSDSDTFCAMSIEPMFEFFLDGTNQSDIAGEIRVRVEMDWPTARDQSMLIETLSEQLRERGQQQLRQQDLIEHLSRKLEWHEDKLGKAHDELAALKHAFGFRAEQRIKKLWVQYVARRVPEDKDPN